MPTLPTCHVERNRTTPRRVVGKRLRLMEQLGICDPPPRARRRDPSTSHAAAKRAAGVTVDHRNRIMAVLDQPQTIYEIGARAGLSHVQVARRMKELQDLGRAEPTEQRRDGCRTWKRT
jgi:hypothetical protein